MKIKIKTKKVCKSISALVAGVLMMIPISAFASGSTGPNASDKTYSKTTYFMKDGTNYTSPQSKFSYASLYNKASGKYYMTDASSVTQKNSSGTVRGYTVSAYTEKRTNLESIFVNNPFASLGSDETYKGSGNITCKVTADAGFPLDSKSSTVTGTNYYCWSYVSVAREGKCKLIGVVTSKKTYGGGTFNVNVSAY